MSEHMKKHLIKDQNDLQIRVNNIQYEFKDIPISKLKGLDSFIGKLRPYKKEEASISWRDSPAIKSLLAEAGKNEALQVGAVALKGMREGEGYSQKKLAELISRDQGVISKMERCKVPIGKTIAKRFEKIFNVSYKIFLSD